MNIELDPDKKTWEEKLNKILIDYDFDKDAPGSFDFVEAEKKIYALITELLRKQREWVNVKDKMPELRKPVLLLTDYGKMATAYFTGDSWVDWMRQHSYGSVTHWMPLAKEPE